MRADAAQLLGALRVLKQLVVKKSALPVLEHVRLEAKGNLLSVEGTDIDTRVIFTIPAVEDLAPVLLPFRRLVTLLEAAGGKRGAVTLSTDGRRVRVEVNGRSFFLDAPISAEEFPAALPEPKASQAVIYDAVANLAADLDWLLPAVSTDPTRPMLTGLCFEGTAIIACDGHRLHMVNGAPKVDGRMLLPSAAARTLLIYARTFAPGTVEGHFGDGTVIFRSIAPELAFTLTARTIQAEFPDYLEIIPRSDSTAAEVSVPQLDAALALATKVMGRGCAKLLLNGALVVEANDPDDGGGVSERIDAIRVHGDAEIEAGVSPGYLRDAICVESATAILGMTDEAAPITVRFPDDVRRLAVVMPMRL